MSVRYRIRIWRGAWQNAEATDKLIVVFTLVIALTGIVYTVFAGFQWREMRKAAVLSNRAWVGVSRPIDVTSLSLDPKNPNATYVVTLKNYGPSVALHVAISSRVVGSGGVFTAIHSTCQEAISISNAYMFEGGNVASTEQAAGDSIFPADESGWHLSDTSINVSNMFGPKGLFIAGCIAYKDQFGKERRTRFLYGGPSVDADKIAFPLLLYQSVGFNDAD